MKTIVGFLGAITVCAVVAVAGDAPKHTYKPEAGYVPDAKTAIAIAVAVWNPIYGKEKIELEKPFTAALSNGVWTVTGTLSSGMVGGVALAEIAKDDCRILRITHGK